MLLNALVQIGKSIKTTRKSNIRLDSELIKYIDLKYPNPPKTDKVIKIIIKPNILEFFENLETKIEKTDLSEFINESISKKERALKIGNIINKINLNIDDLKSCIETELFEYNKDLDYKMLRGEQKGTSVFLSPMMYAKISSKKLNEFPLWKINLDLEKISSSKEPDEIEILVRKFFEKVPNIKEYSKIKNKDTQLIIKAVLSEIFLSVLNDIIEIYELKSGFYFFPLCFDNKWPFEINIFKDYYKAKIKFGTSDKERICEGCGKKSNVNNGLTGELGFFSVDQKSFSYPFFVKDQYQLCNDCNFYAEKGFNYVQNNLNLYLGSRGHNKNPFEMYVIPIAEDPDALPEILKKINFNRGTTSKTNKLDRIKKAANAATIAKESHLAPDNEEEKTEMDDNISEDAADKDFFNIIINLGIKNQKEKTQSSRFSLLLITFYHPEGQSSIFHNILSVEFLEYDKIIKLAQALTNLEIAGDRFYLKYIYHIFGIHKFRPYISKLLNLYPINVSTLCKDAYSNLKIAFFKFMADPKKPPRFIHSNIWRLNTFTKLAGSLNLL